MVITSTLFSYRPQTSTLLVSFFPLPVYPYHSLAQKPSILSASDTQNTVLWDQPTLAVLSFITSKHTENCVLSLIWCMCTILKAHYCEFGPPVWYTFSLLFITCRSILHYLLFFFFLNFYFIHMCIQCLGHFSPLPPLPLSPPHPLDTQQKLFCLISNFVEERV
jgi:hypothetical protein